MKDIVFNTGETQSELTAKYNPEGSLLRKCQLRMLDMLLYFDKVCKEQKIPYRLSGGNVLGAIRHGGFIPWDDDVDVVIMRKDLRRLCDYLIKNPHPQYKLQTYKTDCGYFGAWVDLRDTKSEYIQDRISHNVKKYRGLQIDIFPFENRVIKSLHSFSGELSKKNEKWFIGKHMKVARIVYLLQHRILNPIFRTIGWFFGDPDLYTYTYGSRKYKFHTSKSQFPYKDISFEGHLFPGPADPILYCIEAYGDRYMDLPDVSARDHHKATYRIWD
jgi:lipopolysaccharide cholinephosphotransferase